MNAPEPSEIVAGFHGKRAELPNDSKLSDPPQADSGTSKHISLTIQSSESGAIPVRWSAWSGDSFNGASIGGAAQERETSSARQRKEKGAVLTADFLFDYGKPFAGSAGLGGIRFFRVCQNRAPGRCAIPLGF
jgi:hypothetical protein